MPATANRLLALLEADLLVVEDDLYRRQVEAGVIPYGARRMATAPELAAGTRFAALEDRMARTAVALHRRILDLKPTVAALVADELAGTGTNAAALRLATDYASGTGPPFTDLADLVDDVAAANAADLEALAQVSAGDLVAEQARQGVDVDVAQVNASDVVAGPARRAASTLPDRQLAAAVEHLTRTDPAAMVDADALTQALAGVSERSSEDAARQAANVAQAAGRTAQLRAAPPPDVAYYHASELLDSSTCAPCSFVDGREYQQLDDALADYPGFGGYVGCEGGARCRGTLVIVHGAESPPTIRNQRPAEPRPSPAPPEPPPTPAPSGVDLDLAYQPTPGLEQDLDAAMAEGHYDRAEAIGAELDAREGFTADRPVDEVDWLGDNAAHWRTDPRLTPAERAQLDVRAEAEARDLARHYDDLETAGIDVHGPVEVAAGPGRARERAAAEYADYLNNLIVEAERATNGVLLRATGKPEFYGKYGSIDELFTGPASRLYYYSSRELRDYLEAHPRLTMDEFALARGISDAKTRGRAAAAGRARMDAARRAEEREGKRRRRR